MCDTLFLQQEKDLQIKTGIPAGWVTGELNLCVTLKYLLHLGIIFQTLT